MDGRVPQYARMCKFFFYSFYLAVIEAVLIKGRGSTIDTQSINSMKKHMLRQVPGYDLLLLPPYDTQHMQHRNSMDHLVNILFIREKEKST